MPISIETRLKESTEKQLTLHNSIQLDNEEDLDLRIGNEIFH